MRLRIAVIGTPRSGNTWVRNVLSEAADLEQIAVHTPQELPQVLPERLAVQLHWYRDEDLLRYLQENGFRTLTIARHPLDVLLSVLQFIRFEPQTARWLDGAVEIPETLAGCAPTSPEFLEYATSAGAAKLLSVSSQWWSDPEGIHTRYEDLVANPEREFTRIAARLELPGEKLPAAIAANPLSRLQKLANRHGWQGRPGLWKKLIVPLDAWRIRHHNQQIFRDLGYRVPPYFLTRSAARRTWAALT